MAAVLRRRNFSAVLKKEQLWELCHRDSFDSSFSLLSSDFSYSFSRRFSFDLSGNQLRGQASTISFANDRLDFLPVPPRDPYLFRAGNKGSRDVEGRTVSGTSLIFATAGNKSSRDVEGRTVSGTSLIFASPAKIFAQSQRRKHKHHIFVTGVPKLIRSEIEAACEDFSNIVIGSSSTCILYKGLLSSGVEITVASVAMAAVLWSDSLEAQFRNKIDTLSKVNHKNFLNLFGYCMEEKPFTRMMVFEYAPNGTLFEYLHLGKEAEQLDWATRLRIVMGIAYSVEHFHRLKPAFVHRGLTSSAVYPTEDYAAKLSDFFYWDEVATADKEPTVQSNVYSFGVILFEMMTGRIPYSDNWLPEFPRVQSLVGLIDPTLETHCEDQLEQIRYVINSCANPDPRERPAMREVCAWLKKITGIRPDAAKPRPLLPGILRDMLKLKS